MRVSLFSSPARRRAGAAVAAIAAASAVVAVATPGSAGAASRSVIWDSKVSYGAGLRAYDGDTEQIRVTGDAASTTAPSVRNAGIQAMEIGQCHAAQAQKAMAGLTVGKKVRMSINNPASSSLGRAVRYVDAWNGSAWVDTQTAMLKAGHAVPVNGGDTTRWKTHYAAVQQAAKARVNLFDTDFCGSGPAQSTPLRLWVMWDGDGTDTPNSEYVRVLNSSASTLSVGGWWIRTGGQDTFKLPSYAKIPARGYLTLHVGKGANSTSRFYWGSATTKFPNADVKANRNGSGAYLFDPQGDVRAWSIYPCLYACSDPLAGKVRLAVKADATGDDTRNVNGEYIQIYPAGPYTIDLSYKAIAVNGHTYEFPKGSYVKYGEKMTLHMGKGSRSRLKQYWGKSTSSLANGGGKVEVRTHEAVRLGCKAWGTGRC